MQDLDLMELQKQIVTWEMAGTKPRRILGTAILCCHQVVGVLLTLRPTESKAPAQSSVMQLCSLVESTTPASACTVAAHALQPQGLHHWTRRWQLQLPQPAVPTRLHRLPRIQEGRDWQNLPLCRPLCIDRLN